MPPKKPSLMAKAAFILLILILPFNLIGIYTSIRSYQNSVRSTHAAISFTLDSHAILLKNKINNTNTALADLFSNNTLLNKLSSEQDDSSYYIIRHQLYNSLHDHLLFSDAAEKMFIYLPKRDDYFQIPAFSGATFGSRPHFEQIENYDAAYGKFHISEDETQLVRILYDAGHGVYYGASIDLNGFLRDLDSIGDFPSLAFSINDTPLTSTRTTLTFNTKIADSIYLSAAVPAAEISRSISTMQYALIVLFILYLALIPVLYVLMKRNVGDPLRILNQAHEHLKVGEEDYRITYQASSFEFDEAYKSFNVMASSTQELHREILEQEIANKQLQIDYLQLQIRPHFLLNSFNVLYTLIQKKLRDPAQDMVLFLSDYFRYLFRSGNELQLFSKERKLIEDYLSITRISYPASFDVSFQLDPVLDQLRIPPLLFHSFIENIIAHALLPDRQVHIVFFGEYEDGQALFMISDDGKGIDADALEAINRIADQPSHEGKNVGIRNSIYRLRYYYGEHATVECESEENVGTTFTICIPCNLEEPADDTADRE